MSGRAGREWELAPRLSGRRGGVGVASAGGLLAPEVGRTRWRAGRGAGGAKALDRAGRPVCVCVSVSGRPGCGRAAHFWRAAQCVDFATCSPMTNRLGGSIGISASSYFATTTSSGRAGDTGGAARVYKHKRAAAANVTNGLNLGAGEQTHKWRCEICTANQAHSKQGKAGRVSQRAK